MKAYVHTKQARPDGSFDCYRTTEAPVKTTSTPWKGRTQSGYGRALPTAYMIFWNNRWQRVKIIQFSNAGTAYIGRTYSQTLTVDIQED